MLQLIPLEERNLPCALCGIDKSVKYQVVVDKIKLFDQTHGVAAYTLPIPIKLHYCNRCVASAPFDGILTIAKIQHILTDIHHERSVHLAMRVGEIACVVPMRGGATWFWFTPLQAEGMALHEYLATYTPSEIALHIYTYLCNLLQEEEPTDQAAAADYILALLSAYYHVDLFKGE